MQSLLAFSRRSFSVAFFKIIGDGSAATSEFGKPEMALLDTFNMMFGVFEIDWFLNAPTSPSVAVTLFVAFMIIVPTVMLNALIAIMVRHALNPEF